MFSIQIFPCYMLGTGDAAVNIKPLFLRTYTEEKYKIQNKF